MALDEQEQLEALEKIKQMYKDLRDEQKSLKEVREEEIKANVKLNELLVERFGTQAEFLTSSDVQRELLDDIIEKEKENLQIADEFRKLSKIDNENRTAAQSKRLKQLEKEKQANESIFQTTKETVKELEKEAKVLDEINAKQKNVDALLDQEITQRTGLVTSSQSLSQELARQAIEGGNFNESLNVAVARFRQKFTAANLVNTAMQKMAELGEEFNQTMLDSNGLLMEFAQADIQFVRDTGLVKELGVEVKNLRFEFNDINILAAETDQAFRGLAQSFTDFTEVDANVRRDLTEGAAILERFGVQSDATGKSIDGFTKALGKTPGAAMKTTKEMVKFARALGVGPNKLMGDLNQNFEIFAEFGTKKGVDIFKKLQTAAKQTGIEFGKLTGIIDKFDQSIEGTMEATGDLNFLLGGPFINSMELLEAEGPEKFEILRGAIEESGMAFDEMDRRQKKAIANVLGTDIETASRFFSGQAGDINAATAAVEGQAAQMRSLSAEAEENLTLKERDTLAEEARVAAMQDFADAILKVNQTLKSVKKFFAGFLTLLGAVASAASLLFNIFLGYKMLTGGSGIFSSILGQMGGIGTAIYTVADDALISLSSGFDSIKTSALAAFDSIKVNVSDAFGSMKEKLSEFATNAVDSIKVNVSDAFDTMKDKVSEFATSAVDGARETLSAWKNSAMETATAWLTTAKETMIQWALMAKDAIVKAATTMASWVRSAVMTFTAWVTTTAPAFITAAASMVVAAAPILLPILAIGAAIAGIVIFWDDLVAAFKMGFDFLMSGFEMMFGFIKDGFKMFLHGIVVFAEVIASAVTLPFAAIVSGVAAILDLIPGMGDAAESARNFATRPAQIVRSYASQIHSQIDSFEQGTDATKGGAFIAGDSSNGRAKPELVVAPPMSSVVNNKNLNAIASMIQNGGGGGAAPAGPMEASVPVVLQLDGKVLATHTQKVTLDTVQSVFNPSR
tara:strand:+ start:9802 stop:12702 length:2901 start_codon:yes stop_codon:yes gene_type:complete